MTFCPNCGAERREGSKFCHNCGHAFSANELNRENVNSAHTQSSQGPNVEVGSNQYSNSNTQNNQYYVPDIQNEDPHKVAKILGYIFAILIPLFGIIFGIYLYRCEEANAKKNGKIIIAISIAIWVLSFFAMAL